MDWSQVSSFLGVLGTYGNKATQWIIQHLANLGANISPLGAGIINLILFLLLAWVLIKFVEVSKPLIKWLIVILLILLIASTVVSFF